MYTEKVMDHFNNPRNIGEIPGADGAGEAGSFKCGDTMVLHIKVDRFPAGDRAGRGDEPGPAAKEIIADVRFRTFGCAAAIACSSMLTEMVKGLTLDEALQITNADVAKELGGLPKLKLHCSNLAADALHNAIANYRQKFGDRL